MALAVAADRAGLLLVGRQNDMAAYHGTRARVERVISPHTLELDIPDAVADRNNTRIRLIGVTAPLPKHRDRQPQRGAAEAMQLATTLAEGQLVTLELEPEHTRDTFGRLRAHVVLPNGDTLNRALLEAGLAETDARHPHRRLTDYAKAEQQAQRHERGIWGDALD